MCSYDLLVANGGFLSSEKIVDKIELAKAS